MTNNFWGNVAEDLVKTVVITRTRPAASVDFYSEFAGKHEDTAVTANYQHCFEYLENIDGVVSVTQNISGNQETVEIKFDSMLTSWAEIKKSWEENYLGLFITISDYHQTQNITTTVSMS